MGLAQPIGPDRRDPARVHQPVFVPRKRSRAARFVVPAVVLAAGAVALLAFVRPLAVTTAPVVRGTAIQAVYGTGLVEASTRVTVRSKIAGTVAELRVREGDHVSKGDVIAVIDSPALKYDLEASKAEAWAASRQAAAAPRLAAIDQQAASMRADLDVARKERDRLRDLLTTGSVPSTDVERAEARVGSLEAQLRSLSARSYAERIDLTARAKGTTAQVDSLTARLEDTQVRAPMDGTVLSRAVEAGESVTADQPVVRIGDTDNLVLESSVDESDITLVSVGSPAAVSLYAFSGKALQAKVIEILPDADRARKSFLVKLKLDAPPPGLRTGMTGEVNIIVDERARTLLAPSEGVDSTGGAWIVRDGRAERHPVHLGIKDMLKVEVLDGLAEGDQVVVSGTDQLSERCRVSATPKAQTAGLPPAPPRLTASGSPPPPPPATVAVAPVPLEKPMTEKTVIADPAPSTTTTTTTMTAPAPAPPSATLAMTAAAASRQPEVSPTMGFIQPPASARGHRIFVDNVRMGEGTDPIRLSCGPHNVAIGHLGTPHRLVVPCGGSVDVEDKP